MYTSDNDFPGKERSVPDNMTLSKPDETAKAFCELGDIINKSQIAKQYFGKSQSWFSQRLNGCKVLNKSVVFKEDEYRQIADAFRDIAKRLVKHAERIDSAKNK